MWNEKIIIMLLEGIRETLYMTLGSTFLGYLFGLPMGILLTVSDKDGLKPNALIYKVLDVIANIVRSIPFLILLILIIPFTRLVVGKSYGPTAGGGQDLPDCQRHNRTGHHPRLHCHVRRCGRRRSRRYRCAIWV